MIQRLGRGGICIPQNREKTNKKNRDKGVLKIKSSHTAVFDISAILRCTILFTEIPPKNGATPQHHNPQCRHPNGYLNMFCYLFLNFRSFQNFRFRSLSLLTVIVQLKVTDRSKEKVQWDESICLHRVKQTGESQKI